MTKVPNMPGVFSVLIPLILEEHQGVDSLAMTVKESPFIVQK